MSSEAQSSADAEHRSSINPPADDPLLTEWLVSPDARRPVSSWPPRREAGLAPLGDSVADAWFL